MSRTLTMTEGKPTKLLLTFALPLMLGNIFQQLYTVVDTAIVGRGVGLDALAALGTVDWLNWMFLSIAMGFAQGFSIRISHKYGEKDLEGLRFYAGQSALLSIIIALVCTVVIQLGLPVFLAMLRIPLEIRGMAELYVRVLMAGFPLVMFYNYCSSLLRAVGDSKTPLIAMFTAAVINIALDCVAIFVLKWGVAGAAAATVISQGLSGAVCAVQIWKNDELRFGKEDLKADVESLVSLMRLGTPITAKNILISVGGLTIQTIVNGFGMSFIAGCTAANKLYGLLETAALSYSYAVMTYMGQNYGAKTPDRIKSGMKEATVLSVATSLVIMAIMIVFGRPITMLFISSDDPALMAAAGDTAYWYLFTMSICLPVLYILYVYQAAMQGMGKTFVPLVSGIIQVTIRVVIALIVGVTRFEVGIFIAEVAAWFGSMLFMLVIYYITVVKNQDFLKQDQA